MPARRFAALPPPPLRRGRPPGRPTPLPLVQLVIDQVLHEVERGLRAPLWRIYRGEVAAPQALALEFGWLTGTDADPRRLTVTDRGLKALATRRQQMRTAR